VFVSLKKLPSEPLVCQIPIAELAAVFGGHDCDSGRNVGEPDGRFDFVPVLAARSA